MKTVLLILILPLLAFAQPLQFQLQPGAFPVSVNGFQAFQPWAGGMNETTPTFCDIDSDGDLDLFCGNQTAYISLFTNIGTFLQPDFSYLTSYFDSLHVPVLSYGHSDQAFADLDGDEVLDALVGCGKILYYHNNGTSTLPDFTHNPDTLLATGGDYVIGNQLALADIDADGDMDFFGGDYWGYLKFYQNIGSPDSFTFQQVSSNWFNTYTNEGYADPCFGDLDSDGDLDLLIGTGMGHVMYYRNDGSPTTPQMTLITTNYLGIDVQKDASPELADIDGDGDLDLFVGRSPDTGQNRTQGDVFFYRNDGTTLNPNFTYVTSNYLTWDCGTSATPRLIDINGDGLPDLVSKIGSHLVLYRNQGSLNNPSFVYDNSNFGNITVEDLIPWFVDINGDGLIDLFAGTSAIPGPPGLQLYINHGTPQIPSWSCYSTNIVPGIFNQGSVLLSPWTADIDADGDQDLFVTDNNGYLYFFRNVGTPTHFQFQYETNNWQGLNDGLAAYLYGCFYDIDHDGDLDLFMNSQGSYSPWNPNEKHLRFYRNHGTPQNASMLLENNNIFPDLMIFHAAPFLTDIDGDGDGDLFVGDLWGGCRFFRNITGDSTAVLQPTKMRPRPSRATLTIGPNPSNPITAISYQLSAVSLVNLSVYDISGRRVAQLVNGRQNPGDYSVSWNAPGNASGVYLVRLEASGSGTTPTTVSGKVVILK